MKPIITAVNDPHSLANKGMMPFSLKELLEQRMKAKRAPLTAEKLKASPGLESLSDEDASEAIQAINKMVSLLFQAIATEETNIIDNQQVVYLNTQSKAA